jgi:hypothetical protein
MERTNNKKMNTPGRKMATTLAIAFTLLAAGGAQSGAPSTPEQDAKDALLEARTAYQTSDQLGFAWRPAKLALAAAEAALVSGDYAQVLEHAAQARRLADASVAQAEHEASAWQGRAPFTSDQ